MMLSSTLTTSNGVVQWVTWAPQVSEIRPGLGRRKYSGSPVIGYASGRRDRVRGDAVIAAVRCGYPGGGCAQARRFRGSAPGREAFRSGPVRGFPWLRPHTPRPRTTRAGPSARSAATVQMRDCEAGGASLRGPALYGSPGRCPHAERGRPQGWCRQAAGRRTAVSAGHPTVGTFCMHQEAVATLWPTC